ncbi:hypothetical protein Cma02nite_04480 [Cellulomonas marina]|nr:hypothetical protein Cma02nite_04480 [Cellulomonas marina]
MVHGGFWRARYDLSLGRPPAASLVAHGWAAWNLEYRRERGAAATLADVAAGVDALADVPGLAALHAEGRPVVVLGHSAGGHLAAWVAGARRLPDGGTTGTARVAVTGVVSQAGVLDLATAHVQGLGGGAVADFLGRPPRRDDEPVDPMAEAPLAVPVRCVHGVADDVVPPAQSEAYVARAGRLGGDAALVAVPGGHMDLVDPRTAAWDRTLGLLEGLAGLS